MTFVAAFSCDLFEVGLTMIRQNPANIPQQPHLSGNTLTIFTRVKVGVNKTPHLRFRI